MINEDQMDLWFTYHPPDDETLPKHTALREAHAACTGVIAQVMGDASGTSAKDFGALNAAIREFADVINEQAPDSADKTAAIRCLRLARNAFNEALHRWNSLGEGEYSVLTMIGDQELFKARWQASAAVAIAAAEKKVSSLDDLL